MLTKNQKTVLDTLIQIHNENVRFDQVEFLNRCKLFNINEVLLACKSLNDQGYIDPVKSYIRQPLGQISLTYKGLHYVEFMQLDNRAKWKERVIGFVLGVIITTIPFVLSLLIG